MSNPTPLDPQQAPEFDSFADNYDEALQKGLSLTGESKEFFAQERVNWMHQWLTRLQGLPQSILDFGCGTGGSESFLLKTFSPKRIIGTDVSDDSLDIARKIYAAEPCEFIRLDTFAPNGEVDLAFCNGVFHHIPIADRAQCVETVFRALRPGGYFCFWENNPWNPGTRWVMSRVPFDKDAIMLWPAESRRLLRAAGFEIVTTSYRFIFPNSLRVFRGLEPALASLPLGGQYLVIAQKPKTDSSESQSDS